jgi:hypothetical protein
MGRLLPGGPGTKTKPATAAAAACKQHQDVMERDDSGAVAAASTRPLPGHGANAATGAADQPAAVPGGVAAAAAEAADAKPAGDESSGPSTGDAKRRSGDAAGSTEQQLSPALPGQHLLTAGEDSQAVRRLAVAAALRTGIDMVSAVLGAQNLSEAQRVVAAGGAQLLAALGGLL